MNPGILLVLPVLLPFLGGAAAAAAGRTGEQWRNRLAEGTVAAEFLLMLGLALALAGKAGGETSLWMELPGVCGLGLYFEADGFRLLYGLIAAFMWLMATLLSGEYCAGHAHNNRFYLFLLLTLGATEGVFLSGDLFTTFLFFEIMSFTSYVWVAQEETKAALRAAQTYLAVAVTGGLVMLMGLFLLYHEFGTLRIGELHRMVSTYPQKGLLYAAGGCLLVGFGAKAGVFPLHIWLPKAHPVAPAPASALLSGILTKTGIFGILVVTVQLFWEDGAWGRLLLGLGLLTMAGGAVLAVFSTDLKRTLACSSMSQIGFILVGIGMQPLLGEHRALAVHGTFLHMVNHSLIKLVLFLAAGVIYQNTHALELNAIRGFGRKKPLLKASFLVGALAIAGIPMFSGYISKTLLHESIVEYGGGFWMGAAEWIFLISGGLTAAYMAKLYLALFVEENESAQVQRKYDGIRHYMNARSAAALGGSAAVLLVWGLFPHQLMDRAAALAQSFLRLAHTGETIAYFNGEKLSGALISIAIGAGVYLLVIRGPLMDAGTCGTGKRSAKKRYANRWPAWLDLEELLYRPLLSLLSLLLGILCRVPDSLVDLSVVALRKTIYRDSPLPHELPEGNLLTEKAGKLCNFFRDLCNSTCRRKSPVETDYVHVFAVKLEELKENNLLIGRSLSFALLLLCIGFLLTLFYLIWW